MAITMEILSAKDTEVLTKCPPLADLMKMVFNLPRIKAWIEKRPKTDM